MKSLENIKEKLRIKEIDAKIQPEKIKRDINKWGLTSKEIYAIWHTGMTAWERFSKVYDYPEVKP